MAFAGSPALAAAPPNDDFANAETLTAPGVVTGTNAEATEQLGEPPLARSGGRSVWYRWTAPATGTAVVDVTDSAIEAQAAVYTGDVLAALVKVPATTDTYRWRSRLRLPVVAGVTYSIAVEGYSSYEAGSFTLKLGTGEAAPNDSFATAQELTGTEATAEGDTTWATREAGEPLSSGPGSIWYRWTAPADGGVEIDTAGSAFDTVLGVYTGEAPSALTWVASGYDVSSTDRTSLVRFTARRGVTYRVLVNGAGTGVLGAARVGLRLTPPPANDALSAAVDLGRAAAAGAEGDLFGASAEVGEPGHYSYASARHSVWYSWTAPYRGSLTIRATASFQTVLAAYRGDTPVELQRVVNQPQDWNGGTEQIRVRVEAGETYRIAVDGRSDLTGPFTLALSLIPSPPNDDFADALPLVGPIAELAGITLGATQEPCEPVHDDNYYDPSVWFHWTAPASGAVTLDTTGSDFPTVLGIYTGDVLCKLARVPVTRVSGPNVPAKRVFRAEAGVTYRIAVDGARARTGVYRLSLRLDGAPANDLFDRAEQLTGALAATAGTNEGATGEAGEPTAGGPQATSVWYSWTAPAGGLAVVKLPTRGPGASLGLTAWTGDAVGSLTRVGSGSSDTPLRFRAVEGTAYRIAVDGTTALLQGPFTLSLELAQPPPNDDLANATGLTGSSVTAAGTTVAATREAGEPVHAWDGYGATVWYSWTAPSSGELRVSTTGAPVRAVYTGDAVGSLAKVAASDWESLRFRVTGGATYRIAVANQTDSASGAFSLTLAHTPAPANDDFAAATELSGLSATVDGSTALAGREAGEPAHGDYSSSAGSVWYRWTAPADGVASIALKRGSGVYTDPAYAVYTGTAVGALARVARGGYSGRLRVKRGVTYAVAVAAQYGGEVARFGLTVAEKEMADNDMLADAIELSGRSDSRAGDVLGSTEEPGESASATAGRGTVWYRWTAPSTGRATVRIAPPAGSSYAPSVDVGVYTGDAIGALTAVAKASYGGTVGFDAVEGATYRVAVGTGYPAYGGAFAIELRHVDAPPNDAFAAAERLEGRLTTARGTTEAATAEPGEPSHYNAARASVWYRWTAPRTGTVRLGLTGTSPVLAVYTGSGVQSLTRVAQGTSSTTASLQAQAGTEYRIAVDRRYSDGAGPIELRIEQPDPPAGDAFASPTLLKGSTPRASGHNVGATREAGEPPHGGFSYGSSIWFRWRAPASGRVTIDGTGSEPYPLLGVYLGDSLDRLTVRGWTYGRTFTFDAVGGEVYRIAQDGAYGAQGRTQIAIRHAAPPANDEVAGAAALTGSTASAAGSNVGATEQAGEPDHAGNPGGASVWWRWTAPADGVLRATTAGSGFDTLLGVYADRAGAGAGGGSGGSLEPVAANDDAGGGVRTSAVSAPVRGGTTYWIAVDGTDDGLGPAEGPVALGVDLEEAKGSTAGGSTAAGGSTSTDAPAAGSTATPAGETPAVEPAAAEPTPAGMPVVEAPVAQAPLAELPAAEQPVAESPAGGPGGGFTSGGATEAGGATDGPTGTAIDPPAGDPLPIEAPPLDSPTAPPPALPAEEPPAEDPPASDPQGGAPPAAPPAGDASGDEPDAQAPPATEPAAGEGPGDETPPAQAPQVAAPPAGDASGDEPPAFLPVEPPPAAPSAPPAEGSPSQPPLAGAPPIGGSPTEAPSGTASQPPADGASPSSGSPTEAPSGTASQPPADGAPPSSGPSTEAPPGTTSSPATGAPPSSAPPPSEAPPAGAPAGPAPEGDLLAGTPPAGAPVETPPGDSEAPAFLPVAAPPIDAVPAGPTPDGTPPSPPTDASPAESPVDAPPADSPPAGEPPADEPSAGATPAGTPLAQPPAAEAPPVDPLPMAGPPAAEASATEASPADAVSPAIPPSPAEPPPAAADPPADASPAGAPTPLAVSARFARQRLAAVLSKGLAGTVACSRACTLTVVLTIEPRAARTAKLRGTRLTTARVTAVGRDGSATPVLVRLASAVRAKVRRAKALPVTVTVTARSGAETATATQRLDLRR
ncbi:MAG TPA: hypothetical protein VF520_10175 [Thermoleophilaceae bacterium]